MTAQLENGIHNLKIGFQCPFEDVDHPDPFASREKCPFHKVVHVKTGPKAKNKDWVPKSDSQLLREIGGGDRLRQMMTRFYAHAFKDETLSKFMFDTDGAAAHGQRLADWFIEGMGGEGTPWSDSGRKHNQRQESHRKAWYSDKRPKKDKGVTFQLDDCRIWMRLNFLAGREVGLDKFEDFWGRYLWGITSFIGIYECTAPPYAKADMKWSENSDNYKKYKEDGFKMLDVIGIRRHE